MPPSFGTVPPAPSPYSAYAKVALVRRLPYKVCSKADQIVLAQYFDVGPFFGHNTWSLYLDLEKEKPVLLIPQKEVMAFFTTIEGETGIVVPRHPKSHYCHRKSASGTVPTFVAKISSKEEFDAIAAEYVGVGSAGGNSSMTPEERAVKKAEDTKKKAEQRRKNVNSWGKQIMDARKYLGFDLPKKAESWDGDTSNTETENKGKFQDATGFKTVQQYLQSNWADHGTSHQDSLDKWEKYKDALFVCVDVESWELNHSAITEIGIASIDMKEVPRLQPGSPRRTYDMLKEHIKYRHIRVREHYSLRNGKYVSDNADRFDFGTSEIIPLTELPATIAKCFRPSPDDVPDLLDIEENTNEQPGPLPPKRAVIFVGHDAQTDIDYLQKIGYSVRNIKDLKVFDTAVMYKALKGDNNTRSLSGMAGDLGLQPWNLHNAGNDAAFTLQSLIRIAEIGIDLEQCSESVPAAAPKPEITIQTATITGATTPTYGNTSIELLPDDSPGGVPLSADDEGCEDNDIVNQPMSRTFEAELFPFPHHPFIDGEGSSDEWSDGEKIKAKRQALENRRRRKAVIRAERERVERKRLKMSELGE